MLHTPEFFIPGLKTYEEQDSELHRLAVAFSLRMPEPHERIFSITFRHDGVIWTATVGKMMEGRGSRTRRVKGKRFEEVTSHSDPAMIRAIFPDPVCFRVFTDGGLSIGQRSRWENPFLAGLPYETFRFALPALSARS